MTCLGEPGSAVLSYSAYNPVRTLVRFLMSFDESNQCGPVKWLMAWASHEAQSWSATTAYPAFGNDYASSIQLVSFMMKLDRLSNLARAKTHCIE